MTSPSTDLTDDQTETTLSIRFAIYCIRHMGCSCVVVFLSRSDETTVNYCTVNYLYCTVVFNPDSKAKMDLYNALRISILPFADGRRGYR